MFYFFSDKIEIFYVSGVFRINKIIDDIYNEYRNNHVVFKTIGRV
jgi:hypothetical protein